MEGETDGQKDRKTKTKNKMNTWTKKDAHGDRQIDKQTQRKTVNWSDGLAAGISTHAKVRLQEEW